MLKRAALVRLMGVMLTGAVVAMPVLGGDDLFLVPADTQSFSISIDLLLGSGSSEKISLDSRSYPFFGSIYLGPESITYRPSASFWQTGLDLFRYRTTDTQLHTVYLVADDGELVASEDFEGQGTMVLHDPNGLATLVPSNIEGAWSLRIEIVQGFNAYVRASKPSDPRPDGKVGQGFDPDDDRRPIGFDGHLVIMRGLAESGEKAFELARNRGNDDRLCASAWQNDGSWVTAPCIVIGTEPVKLVLGWGRMPVGITQADRLDRGFMYLLIDGRLAAFVKNLNNSNLFPASWTFGIVERPSTNIVGSVQIDAIEIWMGPIR